MRKTAAFLVIGLALVSATPAGAQQGDHRSCKAFGQGVAAAAHALGGLGGFVQSINTGPGAVAGTVKAFHDELCEPMG
jgi:hypothetical protein